MTDLFLSYAREDARAADLLVSLAKRQDWSVFFDRDSIRPLSNFERDIAKALNEARLVVVFWSSYSVESPWVRAEADQGLKQNRLLQVILDDATVPMPFGQTQALDMRGWGGKRTEPTVFRLLDAVADALERPIKDRKRLEALSVVEDTEFTRNWMLALSTDRVDIAFERSVRPALVEMSSGGGSWDPLVFISYMWLLEELRYSGKYSEALWDQLTEVVVDTRIQDRIRLDTLSLLPRVHMELSRVLDVRMPDLFRHEHIQVVNRVVHRFFQDEPPEPASPLVSNPLDVLTWLWTESSDEARTHLFLMTVNCLSGHGRFSEKVNELMLDESAYETPDAFAGLLRSIKTSVSTQEA